jgi:hypothetical protein
MQSIETRHERTVMQKYARAEEVRFFIGQILSNVGNSVNEKGASRRGVRGKIFIVQSTYKKKVTDARAHP